MSSLRRQASHDSRPHALSPWTPSAWRCVPRQLLPQVCRERLYPPTQRVWVSSYTQVVMHTPTFRNNNAHLILSGCSGARLAHCVMKQREASLPWIHGDGDSFFAEPGRHPILSHSDDDEAVSPTSIRCKGEESVIIDFGVAVGRHCGVRTYTSGPGSRLSMVTWTICGVFSEVSIASGVAVSTAIQRGQTPRRRPRRPPPRFPPLAIH